MKKEILLTGGTGYIGKNIAQRILDSDSSAIVNFWIHAKSDSLFREKIEDIGKTFSKDKERLKFSIGDLSEDDPFSNVYWENITSVIHNAELTNIDVNEVNANLINRDGSIKLLECSRKAQNLEKITYVSTIYASGLKEGDVPENFLTNKIGFSNHYERSKWEVEEYIRTSCKNLPWEIVRLATIISHDETGHVVKYNAVHNTFKLLYHGLITFIPGVKETPIYLVTGNEVAMAITQLHLNAPTKQIFNISHNRDFSLELGTVLNLGYDTFNSDPVFKAKKIIKPLFTEQEYDPSVKSVQEFGALILEETETSISKFGKQLYIQKNIINDNLKKHYPKFSDPDQALLVKNTCKYLVKVNFKHK